VGTAAGCTVGRAAVVPSSLFTFTLPPTADEYRTPEAVAGLVGQRAVVHLSVVRGPISPADARNGTISAAQLLEDGSLTISVALD
jgi:hypothetical protein